MRLILVLLALLLASVSAFAECGFLVWSEDSWTQSEEKGTSSWLNWKLIESKSSLVQCEASSRAKINSTAESIRKSGHDSKGRNTGKYCDTEVIRKNSFSFHTTRYLCVSDSIDPRPKGPRGSTCLVLFRCEKRRIARSPIRLCLAVVPVSRVGIGGAGRS
jgi:hypothetical protein